MTGEIPEEEDEEEEDQMMYDDVGVGNVEPIDDELYEELPGLTTLLPSLSLYTVNIFFIGYQCSDSCPQRKRRPLYRSLLQRWRCQTKPLVLLLQVHICLKPTDVFLCH